MKTPAQLAVQQAQSLERQRKARLHEKAKRVAAADREYETRAGAQ